MGNKELEGVAPASQAPGHSAEPEPASAVSSADAASTPNADDRLLHEFVAGRDGYGFGEVSAPHQYVTAYREAMAADGWSVEPTYPNHEGVESAARLKRDGFTCQMLSRDKGPNEEREPRNKGLKRYEAKIHIWGPDGLAIKPPFPYSFEGCVTATRQCSACRKGDVETHRVGFAGRVCADCLPEQRRRIETRGWCD